MSVEVVSKTNSNMKRSVSESTAGTGVVETKPKRVRKVTEQEAYDALYSDVRNGVIPVEVELYEIVDEVIQCVIFENACYRRQEDWPKHKRILQARTILERCTKEARLTKFKYVVQQYRASKQDR